MTLKLPANMVGIILDRFGRETDIRILDDEFISVRVKAAVSGQFFGWITGLGEKVSILAPEHVKEDYMKFLKHIIQNYN